MANTTTLGDLRDVALKRSDLYLSSAIGRWEANGWLNGGLSELHDLIAARYKQHYFKTGSVTLVAGTESYALPTDFAHMLAVYYVSAGTRYQLQEVMLPEFPERQLPLAIVSGADTMTLMWRTLGQSLYFVPKPQAGATLELWYTPQFVALVDPKLDDGVTTNPAYATGADVIEAQVCPGWEEFVIADFGIKAMIKIQDDPSPWMALKANQEKRIERMAQMRNTGTPQRLYDAYGPPRGRGRRRWRYT